MKLYISIILLFNYFLSAQQIYQGPAPGSVASGITKSTDNFSIDEPINYALPPYKGEKPEAIVNFIKDAEENNGIENTNQNLNDHGRSITEVRISSEIDFEGPNAIGCWVPDCNVIAGPVDMLLAINTMFWITDKQGNLLKQINTNNWFSEFMGPGLVYDPKCVYDNSSKRFIMSYLYFHRDSKTTRFFICVSDDSTAEGNWNMWSLQADLNGTLRDTTTWADFPSLTVTDDAIYILVDMMYYSNPNQDYAKVRAIKKEDVMADIPGSVSWVDVWDFRKPLQNGQSATILKLIHNLDASESIYIIGRHVGYSLSDDIFIYDLKNLFASHEITAHNINISPFYWPPHMVQKDGGEPMQLYGIFYTEMVHRNNTIYAVFAEANNSGSQFSKLHYIEINSDNMSLNNESYISGSNLSYGYGDLLVDENENVFIVFNRSGADEYPGVFYSLKLAGENNFINDIPLMEGQGNMNIYCAGGSSPYIRFVDFSDIQFDPSDSSKIWIMSEYVGNDDRWKTRIGKISLNQIISSEETIEKSVSQFTLEQNYPNPFNPKTIISFNLAKSEYTTLKVSDILGNELAILVDEEKAAGSYEVNFNAENFPSGIYVYTLSSGNYIKTKKMILIK